MSPRSAIAVITCVILVLMNVVELSPHNVYSLSPSFARQEITDPVDDWSLIKARQKYTYVETPSSGRSLILLGNNPADCPTKIQQNHFRIPEIAAVTYLSDGKSLNATLWLSHSFVNPPSNASTWLSHPFKKVPWYLIRYGMSMDVRSVYETEGSDYGIRYLWDAMNNTWTRMVHEISPFGDMKVLERQNNYNASFAIGGGKSYVDLYVNLGSLDYPDQYSVVFYAYHFFMKDGHLCRLVDITNRVFVPPPDVLMSTSPSSVTLRAGEQKT